MEARAVGRVPSGRRLRHRLRHVDARRRDDDELLYLDRFVGSGDSAVEEGLVSMVSERIVPEHFRDSLCTASSLCEGDGEWLRSEDRDDLPSVLPERLDAEVPRGPDDPEQGNSRGPYPGYATEENYPSEEQQAVRPRFKSGDVCSGAGYVPGSSDVQRGPRREDDGPV